MPFMNIISGVSGIVPLFAGLLFFRRLSTEMKLLTLFLIFVSIVELLGFYLFYKNIDNRWLFHIYTLMEYSFIMFIFSNWHNKVLKQILRTSIVCFTLLWGIAKFFFENFDSLDNYTASLEGILLLGIAFMTLYNLSKDSSIPLYKDPRFWVSNAVLIYFSGNLISFALFNIIENMLLNKIIIMLPIHSILNIITNMCYAGGFLCFYPRLNYGGLLSSALP